MANFAFNIAKGRVNELYNRVDLGDPAASRLYVILLGTTVAQATAQDVADFGALITAGAVESTNTGYARKVLASTDIGPFAPDNTNDNYHVAIPNQTWTGVTNTGTGAIVALLVCYASVASPTNGQLTPMHHHDFAISPDGSDVVAQIPATGTFSAS